jgi:hypothetical protein
MRVLSYLLSILIVTTTLFADPRLWGASGVCIRNTDAVQWDQVCARDSGGNQLLVWSDRHTGVPVCYARMLAADLQWRWESPVPVCSTALDPEQTAACAVPGGWVAACVEQRDGSAWIRLQKFDSDGQRLWGDVEVAVGGGYVESYAMASDASGGVLLGYSQAEPWMHYRVFAQWVNADGVVFWDAPLSLTPSGGGRFVSAASGRGGDVLMTWTGTGSTWGLYAARITTGAELPWGDDHLRLGNAPSSLASHAVADGEGGLFVVWEYQSSNVHAQHVDSAGICLWDTAGVRVCSLSCSLRDLTASVSLDAGQVDGVLAEWTANDASIGDNVYVQKIGLAGVCAWGSSAVRVSGESDPPVASNSPCFCSDGSGGAVAGWVRWFHEFHTNHVNAEGNLMWPNPGPGVTSGLAYQDEGTVSLDDSGNAVFLWKDAMRSVAGVRGQKLRLTDADRQFGNAGVSLVEGVNGCVVDQPLMVSMSGNRVGVIWKDSRGAQGSRVYYQVLDSTGHGERAPNGEELVPAIQSFGTSLGTTDLVACPDNQGGFFVAFVFDYYWTDSLYLAHVGADGNETTPPAGRSVGVSGQWESNEGPRVAPDGSEGCYLAYWNGLIPGGVTIKHFSADALPLWPSPVVIPVGSFNMETYGLLSYASGGCTVVYQVGTDVRAAHVREDRTIVWNARIATVNIIYQTRHILSDHANGIYLVCPREITSGQQEIRAWHLDSTGTLMWPDSGHRIAVVQSNEVHPAAAANAEGNLFVVWLEDTVSYQRTIHAQKLSPDGTRQWGPRGLSLVGEPAMRWAPAVDVDDRGGLYAVWMEAHSGTGLYNIFGTHADSTGALRCDPHWTGEYGGPVSAGSGEEWYPSLVGDGCGGWFVNWNANDDGMDDSTQMLCMQRVSGQCVIQERAARSLQLPVAFALSQNFPNPFNPSTVFEYTVPVFSRVKIEVFDLLGRRVTTLLDGMSNAGTHQITWECAGLPSGTYLGVLSCGTVRIVREARLIR